MRYPRQNLPKTRWAKPQFEFTLSRGHRTWSFAFRPVGFYALFGLAAFFGFAILAPALHFIFHDDLLAAKLQRENAQHFADEDRVAALRQQIARLMSARARDRTLYDNEIRGLAARQAKIQRRAALLTALADRLAPSDVTHVTRVAEMKSARGAYRRLASQEHSNNTHDSQVAVAGRPSAAWPPLASTFASLLSPSPVTEAAEAPEASEVKPQPQAIELRADTFDWISPRSSQTPDRSSNADRKSITGSKPPTMHAGAVSQSLDEIEKTQASDFAAFDAAARKAAAKMRDAVAATGLDLDRLRPPPHAAFANGVGGPFIPIKLDAGPSPFDHAALELQDDLRAVDHLRRLLRYLPLRQPIAGPLSVTSPFGPRIDPFFGRLALHPGVDLRQPFGNPVYATAAGKVTIAAPDGGYGNLVQIDHGNGLVTRYGHLSRILVRDGQKVRAGELIGKVGSTGRSTGPHLHYEVRIDGEPVDPMRFLKAGEKLAMADQQWAAN